MRYFKALSTTIIALFILTGCLQPDRVEPPKEQIAQPKPESLESKLERSGLKKHSYLTRDIRSLKRADMVTILDIQDKLAITQQIGSVKLSDLEPYPSKVYLYVKSDKETRVRILNIRPKYRDYIYLTPGRYHIEVSKEGFETDKQWIDLYENRVLDVTLEPIKEQELIEVDERGVQSSSVKIIWRDKSEYFTLVYDHTNSLIWALQSAYVDYVDIHKPTATLQDALVRDFNKKLISSRLDTIVYTGNYSYTSQRYSFATNSSITLYRQGTSRLTKRKIGSLSALKINTQINEYRLPLKSEIVNANPFKRYQKYFGVSYRSGHGISSMNIPIRYLKAIKSTYIGSSIAYGLDELGLYTGDIIERTPAGGDLKYAASYSLITPVRSVQSDYDRVIFNSSLDNIEKITSLVSLLLLDKELEYDRALSRAMNMIFGDPKLKDIEYDKQSQLFTATLYSHTNSLTLPVSIYIDNKTAKSLLQSLDSRDIKTVAELTLKADKLTVDTLYILE